MTLSPHENWVRGVIFHPTNKYLISCSDDKSIRITDLKVRQLAVLVTFLHFFAPAIFYLCQVQLSWHVVSRMAAARER